MKALIIVDLQNDFLEGGALAVKNSNEIIDKINDLMDDFECILATKDWHPLHHVSFASTHKKKVGEKIQVGKNFQTLWPDHCIQNSLGSDFPKKLHQEKIEKVFYKGTDLDVDSYSAFFDNERKHMTGLDEYLTTKKIKDLYFVGLATDYCVLYSVLDAIDLGYNVFVIEDICRAVDLNEGDGVKALKMMKDFGAKLLTSY